MSHIANQRIKKDGKYYAAGDPIELTEEDLSELPEGAASEAKDDIAEFTETVANAAVKLNDALRDASTDPKAVKAEAEKFAKVRAAVLELPATAFKNDGNIRADALKALSEKLGMQLTAENVAVAKNATE